MREVEGEEHHRPHSPARDEHKVSGGDGPRARHAGSRVGRRDARRMGAAGRGRARCSRGGGVGVPLGHRAHAAELLEVLGGEGSYEAQVVGEAAPAGGGAGPHNSNATAGVKTVCCSRTNCLMLAHTMDRCALAVEHPFDCGTMRVHWKLQSVRRTPTTSTATQECPAVSGTKSKRASLGLAASCGTRHDLHQCESRQLATLESHRSSDMYHIKSSAQGTIGRDAVFWFVPNKPAAQRTAEREPVFQFVPQQTGGAVRP